MQANNKRMTTLINEQAGNITSNRQAVGLIVMSKQAALCIQVG
jgi:hypothetical protein